jgi:acetyl esterase/lipase
MTVENKFSKACAIEANMIRSFAKPAAWFFLPLLIILVPRCSPAQEQVIPVWPGVAPGSENWTQKEVDYLNPQKEAMVRNVVRPTLTVFTPAAGAGNGTAVIVCPGGGFLFLSWQSEGTDVARWLAQHGVTAFVLKYRLHDSGATDQEFQQHVAALFARLGTGRGAPGERPPSPPLIVGAPADAKDILPLDVADGLQAIKVVRQNASKWHISPDRIGIIGFSAGAMLTTGVLTSYASESRPDFAASIYGNTVDESQIPADAPPLFILCASDDPLVPSTSSANLYSIWKTAGHSAELHIYSKGGHGFGMHKQGLPVDHWIERYGDWLGAQGLLKSAQ